MGIEQKHYWLGFNLAKGIGPSKVRQLINYFGDVESVWQASYSDYRQAGLNEKFTQAIVEVRNTVDLRAEYQKVLDSGATILTWDDEDYPEKLFHVHNPPPVVYVRGEILSEDKWAVGIVGTRRMTAYGREVTEKVTTELVQNGLTIISGLAKGVDACAHRAALKAGGRTIAVLGSGVDQIYPHENRHLAEEIEKSGAVISDYPMGTRPDGMNFPPRNRIIAGLSMAVIVTEASQKSGALITAKYANEQGRDVFAVPGNIFYPECKGTNWLIQQGAAPLLSARDVLETLDLTRVVQYKAAQLTLPEGSFEDRIFRLIDQEPLHIDEISTKIDAPISQISASLTVMELKGIVRQISSMTYLGIRESLAGYETD